MLPSLSRSTQPSPSCRQGPPGRRRSPTPPRARRPARRPGRRNGHSSPVRVHPMLVMKGDDEQQIRVKLQQTLLSLPGRPTPRRLRAGRIPTRTPDSRSRPASQWRRRPVGDLGPYCWSLRSWVAVLLLRAGFDGHRVRKRRCVAEIRAGELAGGFRLATLGLVRVGLWFPDCPDCPEAPQRGEHVRIPTRAGRGLPRRRVRLSRCRPSRRCRR